jgi:lipopolysaccharide heptosyltransferase I
VEQRWADLLRSCSVSDSPDQPLPGRKIVDRLSVVNTFDWRRSMASGQTWHQIKASIAGLRGEGYEVAIDFQGAFRSSAIAKLSGVPVLYGFTQPRESVASVFYTRRIIAQGSHVMEQNLSLASAVAHRSLEMPTLSFEHDPALENHLNNRLRKLGLAEYAVLNPGAGWGAKRWPPERYGALAERLAKNTGLRSVINFGPGEEDLAAATESASAGAAVKMSCSLVELIALTRQARLFIGGDTGPLHLAAALQVPVVAIFGPTNPSRNGPYGTRSIVLRNASSPTTHTRAAVADEGMLQISVDDVVSAALKLVKAPRG